MKLSPWGTHGTINVQKQLSDEQAWKLSSSKPEPSFSIFNIKSVFIEKPKSNSKTSQSRWKWFTKYGHLIMTTFGSLWFKFDKLTDWWKEGNILKKGKQIEIGGNDKYIPLCRSHFNSEELN